QFRDRWPERVTVRDLIGTGAIGHYHLQQCRHLSGHDIRLFFTRDVQRQHVQDRVGDGVGQQVTETHWRAFGVEETDLLRDLGHRVYARGNDRRPGRRVVTR